MGGFHGCDCSQNSVDLSYPGENENANCHVRQAKLEELLEAEGVNLSELDTNGPSGEEKLKKTLWETKMWNGVQVRRPVTQTTKQ